MVKYKFIIMNKLYKRIAYDFNEFDFQYQYNISV